MRTNWQMVMAAVVAVGVGPAYAQKDGFGMQGCPRTPPTAQPVGPPADPAKAFEQWAKEAKAKYGEVGVVRTKAVGLKEGETLTYDSDADKVAAKVVGGTGPGGFGQVVEVEELDKEVLLVLYINAADDKGVAITKLKKGDVLQVVSATGVCSFKQSDGALVGGVIGIVSLGVNLVVPEASPLVDVGAKYAAEKFGKNGEGQTRDAFGQDPSDGLYEDHEGGILVTLPEACGPCYAHHGLKRDGAPRTDDIRPDHVKHGFFLVRDDQKHNTREITADGNVHILAWDRGGQFEDNRGYYQVFVKVTRK